MQAASETTGRERAGARRRQAGGAPRLGDVVAACLGDDGGGGRTWRRGPALQQVVLREEVSQAFHLVAEPLLEVDACSGRGEGGCLRG